MDRARELLRSGAWLTRERIRLIAAAVLIASAAGFLYLVVTANGLIDLQGRPLGTDFSDVYAAGTYVLDGNPAAPYDPAQQRAREQQIFGEATPFYGWHYPPFFLFIAAALALMPYGFALAVWQAGTLGLYLLMIGAILAATTRPSYTTERTFPKRANTAVDSLWVLLALAFPAVLVNIGHGQNGFLTAALLGAALVQLDRRTLLAGILFGFLAYKPQFGLLIPIVMAASGRWRAFAAAAATVSVLVLVTTLAFGPHVWQAFFDSTRFTRVVALEQGDTGWYKIQSLFAWARMWGANVAIAYALQSALIVALATALIWLWRSAASYPLKAAGLCLAAILATPYTFDYDMMVLAPAIAFIAVDGCARGFGPWEKSALAALWLVPLVARTIAHVTLIPVGVPVMLAVFVLLLRRSTSRPAFPIATSGAFILK
jgi:glycosyl transferase family 87